MAKIFLERLYFVLGLAPIQIWHCAAVFFSQVPNKCTDLDLSLLDMLILGTYSEFARTYNFLALGICFPHPWSSAGRRFAVSRSCLQYYWWILLFPQQKNRLRECLRARRFWAALLLHTTCVRDWCNWRANCVVAKHTKKEIICNKKPL